MLKNPVLELIKQCVEFHYAPWISKIVACPLNASCLYDTPTWMFNKPLKVKGRTLDYPRAHRLPLPQVFSFLEKGTPHLAGGSSKGSKSYPQFFVSPSHPPGQSVPTTVAVGIISSIYPQIIDLSPSLSYTKTTGPINGVV